MVIVNTSTVYINGDKNIIIYSTSLVIQAYNSDIHLNDTMVFYNNKATYRAAIRFDLLSHLFIHESTNASFINNSATFYGGGIYGVTVSTHICRINGSTNNTHIKVCPGKTITTGLRAFDLNGNPTYTQIFARLTKVGKWWHKHKRYSWTCDMTYLLPIEQQYQTVYSNRYTLLNLQ